MPNKQNIDNLLHAIRERFGIENVDSEVEAELSGIRLELEKLARKSVTIQSYIS